MNNDNLLTSNSDTDQYLIFSIYNLRHCRSIVAISLTCKTLNRISYDSILINTGKSLKDRLLEEYMVVRYTTIICHSILVNENQNTNQEEDDLYEIPNAMLIKDRENLLQLVKTSTDAENEIIKILNFLDLIVNQNYDEINDEYLEILKKNVTSLFTSEQMLSKIYDFIVSTKHEVKNYIIEEAKKSYLALEENQELDSKEVERRSLLEKISNCSLGKKN